MIDLARKAVYEDTALTLAARMGDSEAAERVELLLKSGADKKKKVKYEMHSVDERGTAKNKGGTMTALEIAEAYGHDEVVDQIRF